MFSELTPTVLSKYTNAYKSLSFIPLQWNPRSKKIAFESEKYKSKFWIFNFTIVLGFCGIGSCLYLFVRELCRSKNAEGRVPALNMIVLFIFFTMGVAASCMFMSILFLGDDLARGWNCFMKLVIHLEKDMEQTTCSGCFVWKTLCTLIIRVFQFYPCFLVPMLMIANLDPFNFIFNLPPGTTLIVKLMGFILRIIFVCICSIEISRVFAFVFLIFILALQTHLFILGRIRNRTEKLKISTLSPAYIGESVSLYNQFRISFKYFNPYQETFGLILVALAFGLLIFCNYVTIVAFKMIPFIFYLYFPSVCVIVLIITLSIFPPVVDVYSTSEELIKKLNARSHFTSNKYLNKSIRGLRPLAISVGVGGHKFLDMNKSKQLGFYQFIITHTANLILALPRSALKDLMR